MGGETGDSIGVALVVSALTPSVIFWGLVRLPLPRARAARTR